MIKTLIISVFISLFFFGDLQAWCAGKIGTTCKRHVEEENGVQNNFILDSVGLQSKSDGADDRRVEDGDRSENQGYAQYKRWAIGIMVSAYAVPYQDGNQYAGVEGISGFLEHNISEFFTIGATFIDQKFSHLSDETDDDIHHKHVAAYAGIRTWITNRSIIFGKIGIADSKVDFLGEQYSGTTEFMSVGYEYALDESDSSRIGYRYISIAGKDSGAERNIGMSLHGITFQVLF